MPGNGVSWCPDTLQSVTTVHPHKLRFSGSVSPWNVTLNGRNETEIPLKNLFIEEEIIFVLTFTKKRMY